MRVVLVLLLATLAFARYRPAPGGYVWETCAFEVPSNTRVIDGPSTILFFPNGSSVVLPRCPMPFLRHPRDSSSMRSKVQAGGAAAGWQVWSTFQHPDNDTFTSFLGSFSVPGIPAAWPITDDAILYAFTGLQSDNWIPVAGEPNAPPTFDIIQPVIQYGGGSSNGGGKYWGVASWYVTLNDGALWSNELKLQPQQTVFGNMTQLAPNTWFIGGTVNNQTTSLTVTKPRLISQPWAYCTLETYNIANCNWFPASGSSIDFTGLILNDAHGAVTPTWTLNNNGNGKHCTASISAPSPANVVISF